MHLKRFIYATIDNKSQMLDLAEYQDGGIYGAPLEVICYRDIAAVVSTIDVDQFAPDSPLKHCPNNKKKVTRHIC
jgi:hypothetical protein